MTSSLPACHGPFRPNPSTGAEPLSNKRPGLSGMTTPDFGWGLLHRCPGSVPHRRCRGRGSASISRAGGDFRQASGVSVEAAGKADAGCSSRSVPSAALGPAETLSPERRTGPRWPSTVPSQPRTQRCSAFADTALGDEEPAVARPNQTPPRASPGTRTAAANASSCPGIRGQPETPATAGTTSPT